MTILKEHEACRIIAGDPKQAEVFIRSLRENIPVRINHGKGSGLFMVNKLEPEGSQEHGIARVHVDLFEIHGVTGDVELRVWIDAAGIVSNIEPQTPVDPPSEKP